MWMHANVQLRSKCTGILFVRAESKMQLKWPCRPNQNDNKIMRIQLVDFYA